MSVKQTTSYTEQAFSHVQALVSSGEYPNVSAAVSGVLMRDKEQREREAQLLRAELDRRMALPADQWEEWTPGAVLAEYQADRGRTE